MKPNTDWNTINLPLLIEKNNTEINKLYEFTKPFFLAFFKNDEEMFNDLILCILANVACYDPNKGLFSNWIYTIALNKRNHHYQQQKKQLRTESLNLTGLLYKPEKHIQGIDYENWNEEHKIELENRIQSLSLLEQEFVEWYMITSQKKTPSQRQRYSRLVKKLSR